MRNRPESGLPPMPDYIPDIGEPMPRTPGPFICELCRSEIPRGAKTCRVCNARIKYGSTLRAVGATIVVNILLSFLMAYSSLSDSAPDLSNAILIVGWPAAFLFFRYRFRDRVFFSRPWLR